jgi:hypothetical protein
MYSTRRLPRIHLVGLAIGGDLTRRSVQWLQVEGWILGVPGFLRVPGLDHDESRARRDIDRNSCRVRSARLVASQSAMSEACPLKVVRTNGGDEVLARAENLLIGRAVFEPAKRAQVIDGGEPDGVVVIPSIALYGRVPRTNFRQLAVSTHSILRAQ